MRIAKRLPLLLAAAALLAVGLASATSGAVVPPPTGQIACSDMNGVLKFGPTLKSTPVAHAVHLLAVADSCNVSGVTGGSAPIQSVLLKGSAHSASMGCADLSSASALTMQVKVTYVTGTNGNGTKVGVSNATAQLTFDSLALDGSVSTGGFAAKPLRLGGGLLGFPSTVNALCASPIGLSSAPLSGSFSVGVEDAPRLTGFTINAAPVLGCGSLPTGTVTLDKPATGPTFVSVASSDPASLIVDGGGATVPDGATSAVVMTTAIAQSGAVDLTATLGSVALVATTAVLGPTAGCPGP